MRYLGLVIAKRQIFDAGHRGLDLNPLGQRPLTYITKTAPVLIKEETGSISSRGVTTFFIEGGGNLCASLILLEIILKTGSIR